MEVSGRERKRKKARKTRRQTVSSSFALIPGPRICTRAAQDVSKIKERKRESGSKEGGPFDQKGARGSRQRCGL